MCCRQSSVRSRQSIVATTLVEEAEEAKEERSSTPEVSMTAIPELVKADNQDLADSGKRCVYCGICFCMA